MLTSNVINLFSVNSIEYPLRGKQITPYYEIIKEEFLGIILAVHSIKVATRQEANQDVRDFIGV